MITGKCLETINMVERYRFISLRSKMSWSRLLTSIKKTVYFCQVKFKMHDCMAVYLQTSPHDPAFSPTGNWSREVPDTEKWCGSFLEHLLSSRDHGFGRRFHSFSLHNIVYLRHHELEHQLLNKVWTVWKTGLFIL